MLAGDVLGEEEPMSTADDFFLAFGRAYAGMNTFVVESETNNTPVFDFGIGELGKTAGVLGVAEAPQNPPNFVCGVYGAGVVQPGVIGFSRENDGAQGLSFAGTAFRAASFFGPGVHSISGALTGVTSISGTQGPPVGMNLPTIAGSVGSAASRPGVIGTSNALMGVYGFSAGNAGIVGETANPNSFAGFFAGNAVVTGTLTAGVKNAMVAFPDGSQRVLHCMESPEHWFEDFGTAKLRNGRAVVALDADFAKVIKRGDYRVFVTPEGDCRGLYISNRSAASFEVRELGGGKSSVAFSYRIVGRRKDVRRHRRFARIDTRLQLPAGATRAPRKRAPSAAELRAFVARLEKDARTRAPKGAKQALRPFPDQLKREALIGAQSARSIKRDR
jgi:hypothetical protein